MKKKQTKEVEVNLFKKYKYKHFSEEDINFMFLVINNNFALLREPCFYIFITRCIFFFNNFSIFILYYTSYLFRISYLAFVSLFISDRSVVVTFTKKTFSLKSQLRIEYAVDIDTIITFLVLLLYWYCN